MESSNCEGVAPVLCKKSLQLKCDATLVSIPGNTCRHLNNLIYLKNIQRSFKNAFWPTTLTKCHQETWSINKLYLEAVHKSSCSHIPGRNGQEINVRPLLDIFSSVRCAFPTFWQINFYDFTGSRLLGKEMLIIIIIINYNFIYFDSF